MVKCWRCGADNIAERTDCAYCGAKLIKSLDLWLTTRPRLKVYYFSYGYTRDPPRMTREVQEKVKAILAVRSDIVPIVPHFAFDALYDYPDGYTFDRMAAWEVEIISRCDGFVYEPELKSAGCTWQKAIAEKFGVPTWTYEQVLKGEDLDGDVQA